MLRYNRGADFGGVGNMNARIILQEKTESQDGKGATIETWPTPPTGTKLWAEVVPQSSREFQNALKQYGEISVLFRIHFRTIDPARNRIAWRESAQHEYRIFDIAPPMVVGLQDGLLIPGIELK